MTELRGNYMNNTIRKSSFLPISKSADEIELLSDKLSSGHLLTENDNK